MDANEGTMEERGEDGIAPVGEENTHKLVDVLKECGENETLDQNSEIEGTDTKRRKLLEDDADKLSMRGTNGSVDEEGEMEEDEEFEDDRDEGEQDLKAKKFLPKEGDEDDIGEGDEEVVEAEGKIEI